MPIQLDAPPEEVTNQLRAVLHERSQRRRFVTPALSRSATDALELVAPHPVFVLAIDELAGEGDLSAASQVGWRYLVRQGDRTIAAAEVALDRSDVERSLYLNEGPFVGGTVEAIRELEELPDIQSRDVELRLVKVAALYTVAVWLHAAGDGFDDDVLKVIGQANPALEPGALYSAADFVEQLRAPARELEEFDNSPQER